MGDSIWCGPNAAREAAWHSDDEGIPVESIVIPLKHIGPRSQSIGTVLIWGMTGEMYRSAKAWIRYRKMPSYMDNPKVVIFDERFTTEKQFPHPLQDLRGASRITYDTYKLR